MAQASLLIIAEARDNAAAALAKVQGELDKLNRSATATQAAGTAASLGLDKAQMAAARTSTALLGTMTAANRATSALHNVDAAAARAAGAKDRAAMASLRLANATDKSTSSTRSHTAATNASALTLLHQLLALVAVTGGFTGLAAKAITTSATFERLESSFKNLTGSAQAGAEMVEDLWNFALQTPFQILDLSKTAQSMMAYGFAAKEVIPILKVVGDVTSTLNRGPEVINQITLALGQMMMKGKVQSQEMTLQLGQIVPAWEFLADYLGKSTAETYKLVEDGAVDAATGVVAVLTGMMGPRYKDKMREDAKTLIGIWSNMQDAGTRMFKELGDAIVKGLDLHERLRGVMNVMTGFANLLKDKGIQGAMEKVFSPVLKDAIVGIAGAVGGLAVGAFLALASSAAAALLPLMPFVALGAIIATAWRHNWGNIQEVFKVAVTNLVNGFGSLTTEAKRNILIIGGLFLIGGPLFMAMKTGWGIIVGLGGAFKSLKVIALLEFGAIYEGVKFVMDKLSGLAKAWESIGAITAEIQAVREEADIRIQHHQGKYSDEVRDRLLNEMERRKASLQSLKMPEIPHIWDLPEWMVNNLPELPGIRGLRDQLGNTFDKELGDKLGLDKGALSKLVSGIGEGIRDEVDKLSRIDWGEFLPNFADLPGFDPKAFPLDLDALMARLKALGGASSDALGAVGKAAKAAQLSVSDLVNALVASNPATIAAAEAIDGWKKQIEDVNLAIEANKDQIQAAEKEYQGMTDKLSGMKEKLSELKTILSDLASPQLTGMGKLGDQISAVEKHIQRLDYATKSGMSPEAVAKMFPIIAEGMADYINNLPEAIRNNAEASKQFLDALKATKDLNFDESLKEITKAAGDAKKEMTYADVIKQIGDTKKAIGETTTAIDTQEKAIKSQKGVIDELKAAGDRLNDTLKGYQKELKIAEKFQDDLNKALKEAYGWFIDDKAKMEAMGEAGITAAQQVDDAMRTLLSAVQGYVSGVSADISKVLVDVKRQVDALKGGLTGIGAGNGGGEGETSYGASGIGEVGLPPSVRRPNWFAPGFTGGAFNAQIEAALAAHKQAQAYAKAAESAGKLTLAFDIMEAASIALNKVIAEVRKGYEEIVFIANQPKPEVHWSAGKTTGYMSELARAQIETWNVMRKLYPLISWEDAMLAGGLGGLGGVRAAGPTDWHPGAMGSDTGIIPQSAPIINFNAPVSVRSQADLDYIISEVRRQVGTGASTRAGVMG